MSSDSPSLNLPQARIVDRVNVGPGQMIVEVACPFRCRRGRHLHAWIFGRSDQTRPSHCSPSRLYELVA